MRIVCILGMMAVMLMACGRKDPIEGPLSTGPDAFSVLPSNPLQQPDNFSALPRPDPAAGNRADVAPNADALRALGGRPAGAGIPASDRALIAHAARYGVEADIRALLAAERTGGLFGRSAAILDAYAELERFRAAGIQTPTAPPRP